MNKIKKHIPFAAAAFLMVCCAFFVSASFAQIKYVPESIQTSPLDLELTAVGVVDKIIKPDLVRVESGKIYRIDNIRVPLQMDQQAIAFLEKTILHKKIGFYIVGKDVSARSDRFGHTLAHVVTEDGGWLQAQMVSRGLAWVTGNAKSRHLVVPLFKYEDLARSQSLGLWGLPDFAVRNNNTILDNTYNTFQVYEGTIKTVRTKDEYVYFNFDDNPKKDFTISFNTKSIKPFRMRSGVHSFAPPEFIGKYIRIRGWVEENDGPMMTLEFQEQIEFPKEPENPIIYK